MGVNCDNGWLCVCAKTEGTARSKAKNRTNETLLMLVFGPFPRGI